MPKRWLLGLLAKEVARLGTLGSVGKHFCAKFGVKR